MMFTLLVAPPPVLVAVVVFEFPLIDCVVVLPAAPVPIAPPPIFPLVTFPPVLVKEVDFCLAQSILMLIMLIPDVPRKDVTYCGTVHPDAGLVVGDGIVIVGVGVLDGVRIVGVGVADGIIVVGVGVTVGEGCSTSVGVGVTDGVISGKSVGVGVTEGSTKIDGVGVTLGITDGLRVGVGDTFITQAPKTSSPSSISFICPFI